jgi:hypothetical protein
MFRTELTIAPQERQLARTARVLTVGSCFADSIGARLRLNKVNALANPFGTVFQPLALAQLLRAAAGEEQDWQQHVVEARGRWQSYDFHSTIGAESPVELLQTIQETVRRVGDFVRTADAVVLTLGTAWAYRLRETGELVSNLHKLPAGLFEKELLTADEIVNGLAEVHALLRRVNPNIRIVLTVSPVRHIKDTLPLNAVSKSVLRVACHYLSELLPGVSYFPAYELLTDELRDYRFYASDMLHPSEVAEDYIWDKFARAYFDADFGRFRKEWAAVRQSLGHRPLHLGAPEHRTFLDQTAERLERLSSQGVDVRQELRDVQRQLVALPPPKPTRVEAPEPDDDEERIDIGDDTSSAAPTIPAAGREPAGQRSELRSDNRRDGRRNDRNNRHGQDRRASQSALPSAEPLESVAREELAAEVPTVEDAAETVATTADLLLSNPETSLLAPEEAAAYPAKKKKRRSRGGAKRTARKNAARLAAEQGETEQVDDDNLDIEVNSLATEELAEELAHEVAGVLLGEVPLQSATADEAPLISPVPVQVSLEENSVTIISEAAALAGEATAPVVRKRGTGPTPKKSKVITKSGLVPRGPKRNALYRSPAPTESAAEAAEPMTETPAQAPIISPPIIPVALLERPAVLDTMVPSLALTSENTPEPENTPAAPEAASAATNTPAAPASAKPRRGRPKAAAATTSAPAANPDTAPTPATTTETVEAAAPAEPATGKAKAPRATTTKKPAAPKKAAPKKPAAQKPAAKKTPAKRAAPPADETPTA